MTEPESADGVQADTPSVAIAVDGRIAEDRLCIDCGYNLRSLRPDGRCPECGGLVAASLRGHELHTASLPWLRNVCRGFRLMKKAALISIIGLLVTIVIELVWGQVSPDTPIPYEFQMTTFRVLLVITTGLASYGLVLATEVEPRVAVRGEGFSPRRRARVLTIFALALWGLLKLIETLTTGTGWMDQFMVWAPLVLALAGPLAVAAFVAYAIGMLERTADEKSLKSAKDARQTVNLAIALALVVLVVHALGPILKKAGDVGEHLKETAGIAANCSPCLGFLIAIGVLQLIWRMSKTMDRTLAAAEEQAARLLPGDPTGEES